MSIPSSICARSHVSLSIASSAAAMSFVPGYQRPHEYLWRGPRKSAKNSAGSSYCCSLVRSGCSVIAPWDMCHTSERSRFSCASTPPSRSLARRRRVARREPNSSTASGSRWCESARSRSAERSMREPYGVSSPARSWESSARTTSGGWPSESRTTSFV